MDKFTKEEIKAINKTAFNFGLKGINICSNITRNAFRIKPIVITREIFTSTIKNLLPNIPVSAFDRKYYLATLADWENIIQHDFIDTKKYFTDFFDCDNFGFLFSSRAAYLYHLNSCGAVQGNILDPKTRENKFAHIFNIIVTADKKCYLLEPQTDKLIEIEKGKDLIIGNWLYVPTFCYYF